jgi:hypothetical protein
MVPDVISGIRWMRGNAEWIHLSKGEAFSSKICPESFSG